MSEQRMANVDPAWRERALDAERLVRQKDAAISELLHAMGADADYREALFAYGRHDDECALVVDGGWNARCDCGLAAVLYPGQRHEYPQDAEEAFA